MKTIKVKYWWNTPKNFTGCAIDQHKDKAWYKDGEFHRINKPAIEYEDGSKIWYQNGVLHRTDGPAVEYPNEIREYWVNNEELFEKQFNIFRFMWENTTKEKTQELMKIYIELASFKRNI